MDKKILFIEDDTLIVRLYTTRLKLEGFTVIKAEDGAVGMQKFQSEEPDLVVLDLMVPVIPGAQVLRQIREIDREVPILVYSVLQNPETIKEMMAAGANEYLIKDEIHPRQLVERIKSYL